MKISRLLLASAVALGLVVGQAGSATAATFTVNPVRVILQPRANTALVSLKNESDRPLRFQISVSAWTQSLDGGIELSPTKDLVVFPSLLTLEAGAERNVRIGNTSRKPLETEKTYRVFFEELPSDDEAPLQGSQIRILTKMGVPVFIQPQAVRRQAALANVGFDQAAGKVTFDVRNDGNTFFVVTGASLKGLGSAGEVFEKKLEGWYVLAGTARRYVVPLDPENCAKLENLMIHVETDIIQSEKPLVLEQQIASPCKTSEKAQIHQ